MLKLLQRTSELSMDSDVYGAMVVESQLKGENISCIPSNLDALKVLIERVEGFIPYSIVREYNLSNLELTLCYLCRNGEYLKDQLFSRSSSVITDSVSDSISVPPLKDNYNKGTTKVLGVYRVDCNGRGVKVYSTGVLENTLYLPHSFVVGYANALSNKLSKGKFILNVGDKSVKVTGIKSRSANSHIDIGGAEVYIDVLKLTSSDLTYDISSIPVSHINGIKRIE